MTAPRIVAMVATTAIGAVLKVIATFTDLDEANCVLRRGRTYSAIAVQNLRDFRLPPLCQ